MAKNSLLFLYCSYQSYSWLASPGPVWQSLATIRESTKETYAYNVKIITVNGLVTLKGPVKSEEEKRAIEEKAAQIAGNGRLRAK